MPPVSIESSWTEILLLGSKASQRVRRTRWATWLKLARRIKIARHWTSLGERCDACSNRRGSWCNSASLPCSVNPVLTVRHGITGMACMGMGFSPRQLPLTLPLIVQGTP